MAFTKLAIDVNMYLHHNCTQANMSKSSFYEYDTIRILQQKVMEVLDVIFKCRR